MSAHVTLSGEMSGEYLVDEVLEDGRIVLDWVETGSALRPSVCRNFVDSLANELESRIEHAGGRIHESYND